MDTDSPSSTPCAGPHSGTPPWCRCGGPLRPDESARHCVQPLSALDHTFQVSARADDLLSRMHAIRLMGTLFQEPQPLAGSTA